jgi:hypothetical protein
MSVTVSDNHSVVSSKSRPIQTQNVILNQLLLSAVSHKIFSYLADSAKSLTILSEVCFQWNTEIITRSNEVWEVLSRFTWKYISPKAHPDSWQIFYRKRMKTLNLANNGYKLTEESIPIENCDKGYNNLKSENKEEYYPEGLYWDFEW